MNPLVAAALGHSRTVLATLALLLMFGIIAYNAIPKESNPDISIGIVNVRLSLEGVSPDDSERLLLRPVEQEVSRIEGIKEVRSTGYEGGGNVVVEFQAGVDIDVALQDVREAVDTARPELPEEADEPRITEINFSLFPVLVVTLSGDVPERTLLRMADRLQDRIETIPAVLGAEIAGDREEQVEIVLIPELIESYGLQGPEVIQLFDLSNRLVAAGNLDTGDGRFAIKVPGLFEDLEDILAMPVTTSGDAVVTLEDIAEIRSTFKDPEGFARINGERAVSLEVTKRSGENIIATIAAVRAAVEDETATWPDNIQVGFQQDTSEDIRTMLTDLQNNVISAILLVMIVLLATLGARSAGLVGVAIPGSFLTGILVLWLMGVSLNVVVLFALILAVGMLVDGAIVVTEYADRKLSEGEPPQRAWGMAASRMFWPIAASTITTLAAFMPLMFWPGITGEFMSFMPLTLICVLSASLAMALIFVPTLGAALGGKSTINARRMQSLTASEQGDPRTLPGFTGHYVRLLAAALRHPGKILLAAAFMLVSIQVVYATFGKGVEFFPSQEPKQATIVVHARGNLSIHEKDHLVREVEREILKVAGIKSVYARTGGGDRGASDLAEDTIGTITIMFQDWQSRRPASEILATIKENTAHLAGIQVETREQQDGPPQGKDIEIELASRSPELLAPAVERVLEGMGEIGNFIDIEDSRPIPGIEWELEIDRAQAAKFGLDVTTIGQTVRLVTNGLKVAEYRPDNTDDEVDIVLRFPDRDRTLDQLDALKVETAQGSVPVSGFVERVARPRTGQIDRVDQERVMTVKANVAEGMLPDTQVRALTAWFEQHGGLDPRVNVSFTGEDEDQRESQVFLTKAFGAALFIMSIILVTQFNSFYSAFLILSAVVMSTIGVMIGLLITGQPFNIVMTGVGVIALAGIVVNNNIVLIDTFDRLKQITTDPETAILRTGAQRLRPVLLTTVTTVLGLMPMVLQINIDFISRDVTMGAPSTEWWVSLASAIVFGLIFATILTLVVTPCALMMRYRAREAVSRAKSWIASRTGREGTTQAAR